MMTFALARKCHLREFQASLDRIVLQALSRSCNKDLACGEMRKLAADCEAAGMEVHAGWCGPTTAVIPTLKKLQWDLVEERTSVVKQQ